MVDCSRWAELSQALSFHAELARQANAPTEFRLLNGAPPIMVGTADDVDGSHFASLMAILDNSPGGGTPLCRHIREVTAVIQSLAESLRAKSQRACVMIASDGAASDGDVATALRPLKDLPAWVVIRLCTDDDSVVDYWNNVDSQLELEMDVLDDLSGEATEVETANKWLTYAEPLHRLREFGIPVKEFDLLDESLLSMEQFWKTCSLMYVRYPSTFHPLYAVICHCSQCQALTIIFCN